jgi:hypothetical protein
MTEANWNSCDDVQKMLARLRHSGKARLFAVACCRRIWPLLTRWRSRQAVEVTERFADGRADANELAAANELARQAALEIQGPHAEVRGGRLSLCRAALAAWAASAQLRLVCAARSFAAKSVPKRPGEEAAQAALLRCIIGPTLFRPLPPVANAILAWIDGTVRRLAAAIYEDRCLPEGTLDMGRLAVLADALEEAGCTEVEILGHLRGPGPHVRGCWPIDALLGKT